MSSKTDKGSAHSLSSLKRTTNSSDDKPPEKKKITLSFNKNNTSSAKKPKTGQLSIKLASKTEKAAEVKVVAPSKKAAAVFNESSDSEPEEMPLEARMRMKNIGRETPTSAGPNSFNKGKLGFVDNQKSWELQQQNLIQKIDKRPKKK